MSYDGPVAIILIDGTEVSGYGSFRVGQHGHLKTWSGEITSDDFADLARAYEVGDLLLRLAGCSEGKAVASNLSGAGLAEAVLTVKGSGPPPF
jgi:hypothetical protein